MDKELLTIGQVSKLFEVPTHTLRYWEMEFDTFLCPQRSAGKQRRYNQKDVDILLKIKNMLKIDKYSIAGVKQKLQNMLLDDKNDIKHMVYDFLSNAIKDEEFLQKINGKDVAHV